MPIRTAYNDGGERPAVTGADPYEGLASAGPSRPRSGYISHASTEGSLYGVPGRGVVVGSGVGSLTDLTSDAENVFRGQLGDKARMTKEYRRRVLAEVLNPSIVAFLKGGLGIDPAVLRADVLYDLASGRVTRIPLAFTVTPKVWDREAREVVDGTPLSGTSYFRFCFPADDDGRYVALDSGHRPVVQSFPIRPDEPYAHPRVSSAGGVYFSSRELTLLEGVGVSSESLLGRGWGCLPREERAWVRRCLDCAGAKWAGDGGHGIPFQVFGRVRAEAPLGDGTSVCVYVSVGGMARFVREGGALSVSFASYGKDDGPARGISSLEGAVASGPVELELFEDAGGGRRVPNLAGRELMDFGLALRPVWGTEHDPRDGSVVSRGWYQVSAVGGGSACMPLRLIGGVPSLREPRFSVDSAGNVGLMCRRHLLPFVEDPAEVAGETASRSSADGWSEALAGSEGYCQGFGGFLKENVWERSSGLPEVYDAYVIADVREGGFPCVFSPEDTLRVKRHLKEEWCRMNGFDPEGDGMPSGIDWRRMLLDRIFAENPLAFAAAGRRDDFGYGWDKLGVAAVSDVSFAYDGSTGEAVLSGKVNAGPCGAGGVRKEFRHKATADEASFIGVCDGRFPAPVVQDAFLRCLRDVPAGSCTVYALRFNRDVYVEEDPVAGMLSRCRAMRDDVMRSRAEAASAMRESSRMAVRDEGKDASVRPRGKI